MIKGYPAGSDISLLNCYYIYPRKNEKTGKWDNGCLTIIYFDQNTGEIKHEEIENPTYDFYVSKKGIHFNTPQFFVSKNDIEKITCPYKDLNKKVAELTGQMDIYKENIRTGNRRENFRLHLDPNVFNSDLHIEDFYRQKFDREYQNRPIPKITKLFFDIEYDSHEHPIDYVDREGNYPINAVSLINEVDKRIYILLLRNPKNPLIADFENYVNSGAVYPDIKSFVQKEVGGWKEEIRYGLNEYEYKFMFFDQEIRLIKMIFDIINYWKPNFVLAWNGSDFDNTYIFNRIGKLGYSQEQIISDPSFKHRLLKIFVDNQKDMTGKGKELAARGDYCFYPNHSVFLDQMIQFASIRKGQSKYIKYSLDYIGEVICGVRKLDYSHITPNLCDLPYVDYKTFVFYNIMDTIVQYCIDRHTKDTEYVYNKSLMNNVRYSKVHRQTTYQTNRMSKEFYDYYEDGLILGNNCNVVNQKPKEKYPGAYVADPLKLGPTPKLKLHGVPINMCQNVVDYDYSAQYPNQVREHNMAPHTQIGKLIISKKVWKDENHFKNKYFDRGGQFLEDWNTRNTIEFCYRYLHFGNYMEVLEDVIEYLNMNSRMYNAEPFREDKLVIMRKQDNNQRMQIMERREVGTKSVIMIRKPKVDYSIADKINIDDCVYNKETRYIKLSPEDKKARQLEEDDE